MRRNTILVFIIVIILTVVAFFISQRDDIKIIIDPVIEPNEIVAIFVCDYNINVSAVFKKSLQGNSVDLNINNGERKITLSQTISASGARYINPDETLIFWNKGDTAFIQENEEIIIDNCVDIKKLSDTD